jgi:hypothetical protein
VFTHENHLFLVLPLLALAWPARHGLLAVYGLLSATLLLNPLLHDQLFLEAFGRRLDDALVGGLRLVSATANVLCLGTWAAVATRRRSVAPPRP